MKEYIKTESGLEQVGKPKIRIYDSVDDFEADLNDPNTTLEEGDLVGTEFVEGTVDVETAVEVLDDKLQEALETLDNASEDLQNEIDNTNSRIDEINEKIDLVASDENKVLSKSSIYQIIDTIEPVGTIKGVYASSGWDEHWQLCDGTNGTPDLRGYVPMGVDDDNALGSTSKGLIPNITGTTRGTDDNSGVWSGAFYEAGGVWDCSGDAHGTYGGFDASRCSSLYGTTDKVIPANVRINFIMKISTYN